MMYHKCVDFIQGRSLHDTHASKRGYAHNCYRKEKQIVDHFKNTWDSCQSFLEIQKDEWSSFGVMHMSI